MLGTWFTDHALWLAGFIAVAAACLLGAAVKSQQKLRRPSSRAPMSNVDRRPAAGESSAATAAEGTYRDAPTMRLAAHERIDRLHKRVTLQAGAFEDVLEHHFGMHPRLRITLRSIERGPLPNPEAAVHAEVDVARMHLEIAGATAGCGAWVRQTGNNEFLLPLLKDEEHRCSVFHFTSAGDSLTFVRVCLVELDKRNGTASFDVVQVCGQWLASR